MKPAVAVNDVFSPCGSPEVLFRCGPGLGSPLSRATSVFRPSSLILRPGRALRRESQVWCPGSEECCSPPPFSEH
ncbi:hypothetical protein EYF80_014747 [Liparis tanakae]|uniref:Uncharacterized protein n=1 Tax=Liparis tanakae TaxID=230148 RepID=A0A4Z2IBC0_9TELE|nr:hypothetical protein EYF80_014747 [Liparis tanakae]